MTDEDDGTHYKGHTIRITVSISDGQWRWSYVLDGNSLHEMRGRGHPTEELAIAEAQDDARRRINTM